MYCYGIDSFDELGSNWWIFEHIVFLDALEGLDGLFLTVEGGYFIKGYFFAEVAGVGLGWRLLEHSSLQLQQFILASVL